MAAPNSTPISLYHSTTAAATPTAGNLVNGELAINITDGKLFYKDNLGAVQLLAEAGGGGAGVPVGGAISLQASGDTVTIDGSVYQKTQTTVAYNPSLHDLVKLQQNASGSLFYGTEQTSGVFGNFNEIAYSASLQLHVAVGAAGLISTSPDGVTWTTRVSNTTVALNGVYFANSLFVAVGASGVILTSTDGISWTVRLSGVAIALQQIVYSTTDSKFFISGDNLTILSSPTGTTWTKVFDGQQVNGIAYSAAADVYVAVGAAGAVYTSPDGVVWTYQVSGVTTALQAVAFSSADTLFVAVGAGGIILTSPTGTTWTVRSSGTANALNGITYATDKDLFVAVGATGTIVTSQDGISWTTRTSPTTGILNAVSYSQADSVFVAVGNTGVGVRSSDGITWLLTLNNQQVNSIAFDGSTYVAVGAAGAIWTSTDTVNWTLRQSTTSNSLNAVAYSSADTLFVAVGAGGTIVTSPTGTTWTARTSGTTSILLGIAYSSADDIFVAVGATGVIVSSSNGITWTARTSGIATQLNAVAYSSADDKFVAVGASGNILYSADGITWTIAVTASTFNAVAYSPSVDLYVAVCNVGLIYTSPNQSAWTKQTSGIINNLNNVCWSSDFNLFIAVGAGGTIITSPDGVTWTARTSGTTYALNSVAAGNSIVMVVGGSGTLAQYVILKSTNGTTYTAQTTDAVGATGNITSVGFYSASNTFVLATNHSGIATSTDGVTWTNRSGGPVLSNLTDNIYYGSAYSTATGTSVTGGTGGFVSVINSTFTQSSWKQLTGSVSHSTLIRDVAYSPSLNMFCCVGSGGIIYTSTNDGVSWTSQTSGVADLISLKWSASLGLFIASGNNAIITSTDGVSWTSRLATGGSLALVLNTDTSTYYAISTTRTYTSTNGTAWTDLGASNLPTSGGQFEYFSVSGRIYTAVNANTYTSTNGTTWISIGNFNNYSGSFVATSTVILYLTQGKGSYSYDGVNFTAINNLSVAKYFAGYFDSSNNRFVIPSSANVVSINAGGSDTTALYAFTTPLGFAYKSSTNLATFAGTSGIANGIFNVAVTSTNGTTWIQNCTNYGGGTSQDITYDLTNDLFLSVTSNGGIFTSSDAVTWTSKTSNVTTSINAVIGNATDGVLVMGASNFAARSSNTNIWTTSLVGTTQSLNGITYGSTDDLFVAVGAAGNVLTSPNGTAWTYQTPPTTAVFNAIAYDSTNDLFVAVGAAGAILTSPDAITWTARISTTALALTCAYFDTTNRNLVGGATGTLLASTDGASWTGRTVSTAQNLLGTAYGSADDLFVVVGATGTILTSPNGSDWTTRTSGVTTQLNAVTYDSTTDLFVVVGNPTAAGFPSTILTSSTGTTWVVRTAPTTQNLNCITSTSTDGFVVGATNGVVKSTNGTTWVPTLTALTATSLIIRNSDNLYLATGGQSILKSTNPSTWTVSYYDYNLPTPQTVPAAAAYLTVNDSVYAPGLNLFVAVGIQSNNSLGYIFTSSDAVTWTKTQLTSQNPGGGLTSIQYGNGLFMIGSGPVVQTSSDAVTWTPYSSSTTFSKISYDTNNTKFVLAGASGTVSTQPATFTGNPNSVVPSSAALTGVLQPYMRTL